MNADKILDALFKAKVLLNEIADGVVRPGATLHVPKGAKCKGCPAYYEFDDHGKECGNCGLSAMWGEMGQGAIGLLNGDKSQACLEDTKHCGTIVTSTRDSK